MLSKTKIVLAAALLAASASTAFAQEGFFPSMPNHSTTRTSRGVMQSAPASLSQNDGSFYFNPVERSGTRAYPGDRAGHLVDGGGD